MQYIQIGTWQALLGIAVIIFGIGVAWGTLRNEIKNVGNGLKDLKGNFDAYIQNLAVKAAARDGQAQSPFTPSPDAARLLEESGAKEVIDQKAFKDWFFPLIDKLEPKADFEVEQNILSVLLQTKNDQRWNGAKEYIFNHPIYGDRPLTVERLLAIVSWVLRDEYIAAKKSSV